MSTDSAVIGLCQACRRAPVEAVVADDDPEQPYRLCHVCESRLQVYALRPLEWFNLAALHGPDKHLLHDDFYYDNGIAGQPEEDVEEPEKYPAPTLPQAEGDMERLIDYAMTPCFLDGEVVSALVRHPKEQLLAALRQRVEASSNVSIESTTYEICARVLGTDAEHWIRERWNSYHPEILQALAEASASCLPFEEGFQRVTEKLEVLGGRELDTACFALAHFRSPRTLEWIEAHQELARTDTWGTLAALSRLSWPKVTEWLDQGRPLSHVALAALQALLQPNMLTSRYAPVLEDPAPAEQMSAVLVAYYERDPVPNVRNRVRSIQGEW